MMRLPDVRLRALLSCLGVALLTSGCGFLSPSFKAPVEPFVQKPATTGDLVQQVEPRTPTVDRLQAVLEVTASGGPVRGTQRLRVLTLFAAPDRMLLKGDHAAAGAIFIVRQDGPEASVYLPKDAHWYRGTVAELDEHPEALLGLHPVDFIHTLLSSQIVLDLLQAKDMATPLAEADNRSHWLIGTDPGPDRYEIYYLRQSDGLVGGIVVMGANNKRRLTVDYQRYAMFNGVLFPSEFRLRFDTTHLTLRVVVKDVSVAPNFLDTIFSTKTPPSPDILPQTFAEWFARPDLMLGQ
jgi:hypothetical protein